MPLTDTAIKKAKPGPSPAKLSDGKGMYLLVNPNGSRLWRWKYRADGKEKVMALGSYPDVSLARARDAMGAARKVLAAGSGQRPYGRAQSRKAGQKDRSRKLIPDHCPALVGSMA